MGKYIKFVIFDYSIYYLKINIERSNDLKHIVIINGKGNCGKDTFVRYCKKKYHLTYNISTVDRIKEALCYMGVNIEDRKNNMKIRKLISDFKDMMTKYNNHSIEYIKQRINKLNTLSSYILFVHSREPKEIKWFVENLNAKTILIIGKDNDKEYGNHSDDNVENYKYDYYINNNGTLGELEEKAIQFVQMLEK